MKHKIGVNTPFLGEILGIIVVIMGLLLEGDELGTVFFWLAHDMVIVAITAREFNEVIVLLSFALCIATVYFSKKIENEKLSKKIVFLSSFFIGIFLGYILIFILLDYGFFQGALITIPFMLGSGLLIFSISQRMFEVKENRLFFIKLKNIKSIVYLLVVGILIIPNFAAMSGMLSEPPSIPSSGFGSDDRPYDVNVTSLDFIASNFIVENMTEESKQYDWDVHIYTPIPVPDNMPLAIFLHGYEGEEESVYIDTLETIASRGVAVIFPQYASNYDVSMYDDDYLEYDGGGSNHPQHEWRYTMAWEGVSLGANYLENNFLEYDSSHLWVGGHSMGTGTSMYVVSEAINQGWGNNSLIINLEAPWVHSNYSPFNGNMSNLPDHTIVNVVEYEDDIVVERCIGVWEFDRIKTRDGSENLNENQVAYLKVYSDTRGFPKLISSHYIQATMIRDSLADHAYYKRIDAQASFLFGSANNYSEIISISEPVFKGGGASMTDMGDWSDGVPVKKIEVYSDPVGIDLYNCVTKPGTDDK